MAEKDLKKNDLSSDDDVEADGEPFKPASRDRFETELSSRDRFETELSKCTPDFKTPQSSKNSDRIDSGLGCSLELKSHGYETSGTFVDKTPVQCSDAQEDQTYSIDNELQNRLKKLELSEVEDEGHCSGSLMSIGSSNSEQALQESLTDEIEIDLFQRDVDGDTVLHVSILSLLPETALVLIDLADNSTCLNLQNYLLQSPMHLAVHTGQIEILNTLISKGADVTLRDQQGNTPLHIACRRGDRDAVSSIVGSFGKNTTERLKYFSIKNCEGLTCLHVASQMKEFIILGHLFAKGADVNIGDAKSGRTLLHYAVERKDIETVSLLLTHPQINVDCKTFKGETPLVLAFWRNYQDIVRRLKNKGAYFSYDVVEESDDEYAT